MTDKVYSRRRVLKQGAAVMAALYAGSTSAKAFGLGSLSETDLKPSKVTRALHLVTLRLSFKNAERLLHRAQRSGFNTFIPGVVWKGSSKLKSTPWVKNSRSAWSPLMLNELSDLSRSLGFEVIPQLPLLTKVDKLFQGERPDLLFNKSTYDPRKAGVYDVVLPIIDELIELMSPRAIHIGHDEIWGWKEKDYQKRRLEPDEIILPAELYIEDVRKLHEYLTGKNVKTWMWGDMLIAKEEFPNMTSHGSLHPGIEKFGYGRSLREKTPRDIVICDWHYRNKSPEYPTLKTFVDEGYKSLGVTFHNERITENFTHYAAQQGAAGMMATTWYYVQRKDWETVEHIIEQSGRIFSKYFS